MKSSGRNTKAGDKMLTTYLTFIVTFVFGAAFGFLVAYLIFKEDKNDD